jgi:hypothetical protein
VVVLRKPKLGQVNSAGQVKAGGLVPGGVGATEVLDDARKVLESVRKSGPEEKALTVVEGLAVNVVLALSVVTAQVVAERVGSSRETPRRRAATAARTPSGAGVVSTNALVVVVGTETGSVVDAMRHAGTGGVGSAVVALATAK